MTIVTPFSCNANGEGKGPFYKIERLEMADQMSKYDMMFVWVLYIVMIVSLLIDGGIVNVGQYDNID
ncbi:hypothetical protein [Bacillus manliponensis]|uniref:hypothetical protein n=1 Tax=Bacillus manliponensis TaxID=574376 RepID=UPI0035191254